MNSLLYEVVTATESGDKDLMTKLKLRIEELKKAENNNKYTKFEIEIIKHMIAVAENTAKFELYEAEKAALMDEYLSNGMSRYSAEGLADENAWALYMIDREEMI